MQSFLLITLDSEIENLKYLTFCFITEANRNYSTKIDIGGLHQSVLGENLPMHSPNS